MHRKRIIKQFTSKRLSRLRDTRKAYTIPTLPDKASQHTRTNPKKIKRDFPFPSSRQARSFGPYRGKNGARFGVRTHSIVVSNQLLSFQLSPSHNSLRFSSTEAPFSLQPLAQPSPVFVHRGPFLSPTSRTTLSNNPVRFPHTLLSLFRVAPPPSFVPRPFWACLRSLGQSGKADTPPAH